MTMRTAVRAATLPPAQTPPRAKSFLKWAGGKFRVLDEILPRLPNASRLIEPFAGSAVVALNAGFERALVADANRDLINLYKTVQDDPATFIAAAIKLFGARNTKEDFLELRSEFNATDDTFRRSVLFVYLNRHGFNGLCRYNSKGGFNVPFGRYDNPTLPEKEIIEFSRRVQAFEFSNSDFTDVMTQSSVGDVIYCDPPYVPLSVTSSFTSYAPGQFGFAEQRLLADLARRCASKGVPVIISNHDTPEARALYKGSAELHTFSVHRAISSKAETRGKAKELLAVFR